MNRVLQYDDDGWLRGLVHNEGPNERPVGSNEHPVGAETFDDARNARALRVRAGVVQVPHDDRDAWRRYRQLGHSGAGALRRCRTLATLRGTYPDAGPITGGVPHGSLESATFDFPEVPGLRIRPFGGDDLDVLVPPMIDSGLQPATCPPTCGLCQPPAAHAWLQTAARLANEDSWQFCLEFQGRPLQHEKIRRDPNGLLATFALTVHHSRERPSWFWREAERPVFQLLLRSGIRFLQSRTRADRPDWIASLQANYGATVLGDWGPALPGEPLTKRLEFPVDLGVFTGWPTRKQVGFDQTVGRVRVWEATAADLPALRQLIDDTVPIARKPLAHRIAEEWWHLDRATLLLGARDGVLRYARVIRPRRGTQGSLAFLSGMFDEPELEASAQLVLQWAKQAGYTMLSIFAKPAALAAGSVPQMRQNRQARIVKEHTQFRERFTEIEFDVP